MSIVAKINRLIDKNKFSYFGIMSATITAGTCIASGAVIAIMINDAPLWQLFIVTVTAMTSNAASISHSPLRWVVWIFMVNLFFSLLFIGINIA